MRERERERERERLHALVLVKEGVCVVEVMPFSRLQGGRRSENLVTYILIRTGLIHSNVPWMIHICGSGAD